jgi:cysteine desulfuration protein SufE
MSTAFDFNAVPFGSDVSADDVVDALSFFDDWEQRYGYIIDLGKQLPSLPDELKTDEHYVHGCQSNVWLVSHYDDEADRMRLGVDSDGLIVKGLAALVLSALNNQPPQAIVDYDMEAFFNEMGLIQNLFPSRGNGLRAMVARIKHEAEAATA